MKLLPIAEIPELMEEGWNQGSVQRALILLQAAFPESSLEELASLSIGRRDARLLKLRETLFGPHLQSVADCPQCSERIELKFEIKDICITPTDCSSEQQLHQGNELLSMTVDGIEINYRLPNSFDLIQAGELPSITEARTFILRQCVLQGKRPGLESDSVSLQKMLRVTKVCEVIIQQMEQADPQADIQLKLVCFACEHQWLIPFDILTFLWKELETRSHRVLQDVHILAATYHWKEVDILAMSPWRRRMYLSMING